MSSSLTVALRYAAHQGVAAAVLTVFVSSIAYLHNPRIKALVYSLPVPFTCAYLATRMPINSTHVSGLALVVLYNTIVFVLNRKLGLRLLITVPLAVSCYLAGAALLRPVERLPIEWLAGGFVLLWLATLLVYHPHAERGHRSQAPWWIKAPLVFVLSLIIYSLTGLLGGGVVTFPYAGVFTSYEMRHSLRTLAGQFAINSIAIWGLIVTIAATQNRWPHPWQGLRI